MLAHNKTEHRSVALLMNFGVLIVDPSMRIIFPMLVRLQGIMDMGIWEVSNGVGRNLDIVSFAIVITNY